MVLKDKAVSDVPYFGEDPAIYEFQLLSGESIQIVKVQENNPILPQIGVRC